MTEFTMASNPSTPTMDTSEEQQTKASGIATKYQLVSLDPQEESGSFLLVNQSLLAERKGSARNNTRAPVVSFFGSSGAGKSTLASLLISDTFPPTEGPNIAEENQLEPETEGLWCYPGIHLSSESETSSSIVIDTEAMNAQVPGCVAKQLRDEIISPHWLHDVLTQHVSKRKRLTTNIVPALLYLISDVVVFVHQNPTHDRTMVDTLIEIGDRSYDNADNIKSKPALMIIQNKFRMSPASSIDDVDVTQQFLHDFDQEKRLSKYYEDVRVLRVPKDAPDSMNTLFCQSVSLIKRHLSEMCDKVPGRFPLQAAQIIGLQPIQSEKLFWMLVERLLHKVNETLHSQNSKEATQAASLVLNGLPADITIGLFRSMQCKRTGFKALIAKIVQLFSPDVQKDLAAGMNKFRHQYPGLARDALEFVANALALDILSDAEIVSLSDLEVARVAKRSFEFATKLIKDWAPCTSDTVRSDGKTYQGYPCTLNFRDHEEWHSNPSEINTGQTFCTSGFSSLSWPGDFEGGDLQLIPLTEFVTKVRETVTVNKDIASLIRAQVELLKRMFSGQAPPLGHVCATCLSDQVHVMMSCGHATCTRDSVCMGDGDAKSCPLHDLLTTRVLEVQPGRLQLPIPQNAGVRVLSLDGGGMRGLVIIMCLQEIKRMAALHSTNLRIYELFDVIVGTSAGSLGACKMGLGGLSPDDALEIFKEVVPKMFVPSARRSSLPNSISKYFGPRYDDKIFDKVFKPVFGDLPLCNSVRHEKNTTGNTTNQMSSSGKHLKLKGIRPDGPLMTGLSLPVVGICAYDVTRDSVTTFSSHDCDLKLLDAVRASCAAPTFYPTVVLQHKGRSCRFTDGEIRAKCPAAEGKKLVQEIWPERGVDLLLSLGTGVKPEENEKELDSFSDNLPGWMEVCANITMSGEMVWRDVQKDNDCFIRINPGLDSGIGHYPLDSLDIPRLESLITDWLSSEDTQQQLRSVVCKLAAKMYFLKPQREISSWRPGEVHHVRIVQRLPRFQFKGEDFRVKVSLGNNELRASAMEVPGQEGEFDITFTCPAKAFKLGVALCMLGYETAVAGSPMAIDPTS